MVPDTAAGAPEGRRPGSAAWPAPGESLPRYDCKTWEQLGCEDNAGFAPCASDRAAYALTR
ncbi:hypothetical protein [Streptomyces sp. NPDC001389]|uniref:hypothetical protein n=1 Tax=unclassified Streptomyces TaxID=2593676 RepID=UPI0036A2D485